MNTLEYLNESIEEHFDGKNNYLIRKAELLNKIRTELQYHAGEAHEANYMGSEHWYRYHHAKVLRLERWEKVVMNMK